MQKYRLTISLSFVFVGFLLPVVALAAVPPLVPCTSPDAVGGTACTLCMGVTLIQNIINYAIVLAFPISAILFAYAGFRLMTSGGELAGRNKAKQIFTTTAIGFLFVLGGYFIVDIFLHTIIINANSSIFQNSSWFSVGECTGTRPARESVSTWLGGLFSVQPAIVPGPSTQTPGALPSTQDAGAGVGTAPGKPNAIEPSIQSGVSSLDSNALSASSGNCAYYVRTYYLAPEGYADFNTDHPASASAYGPYLQNDGFTVATQNTWKGYTPQTGDVAVFQPVAGHPNGHIEVYDGTQWVSDFKQNGFFPANAYSNGGNYTIYSPPRRPST